MSLIGIQTKGTDTPGANYRRQHPTDLPDQFIPDVKIRYGNGTLTTGSKHTIQGIPVMIMAGRDQQAIIIDTITTPGEKVEQTFQISRLIRWRGLYWRVGGIYGTFVQMSLWGARKERKGWRLHSRGKVLFAERAGS